MRQNVAALHSCRGLLGVVMKLKRLATLLVAAIPAAAPAAPSVFVSSASGTAWWISPKIESRVIGTSAGGITAESLSKYIQDNQIYFSYKVCSLAPIASDTYVGVDKTAQEEIDKTHNAIVPEMTVVAPDGAALEVRSVLFEACDDPDNRGAALLVTNAQNGAILAWEPMGTFESGDGATRPIVTIFLSKPSTTEPDPPLFRYSHCFECSPSTAVYYDARRKKLYKVYNGA